MERYPSLIQIDTRAQRDVFRYVAAADLVTVAVADAEVAGGGADAKVTGGGGWCGRAQRRGLVWPCPMAGACAGALSGGGSWCGGAR